MDLYGMDLIGKAERIKHVAEDDEERNVVDISEVCEEEDGESSDTDTNDALHLRESGDISAKEGKIREVIQEKKAVNSTRKASKTLISEKDDSYRENFPSSCSRWKSLEIHCNNSQSLQQSSVSTSDSQRLPELSFNRLQPCDKECDGLHRQFGRFLAREAVLDEEYWTAAWLRAEAHWESISYMRHIEAFKRKYAQQEFYALKSLCSGQDGNSLKRFCLVTTAGAVGGVAASLIRVPTEVVKQRMQAGQFVSAPDAVRLIVAKEGFKGLYATAGAVGGDAASLIRVPTERMQAGQFVSAPDAARLTVAKEGFKGLYATAGAVGGVAASLIRVPTEVVKQRMQAGQFVSAPDAVHLTVAKEGFKGLYAGYRSFLLRDLPFDYEQLRIGYKLAGVGPRVLRIGIGGSIFFGVLESTKRFLAESRAKRIENPVKKRFLAGCSYRNKGAY